MSEKSKEEEIQREARSRQKFSLARVIGRQAGGAMKGASPIPRLEQAKMEIVQFIDDNLTDPSGALKSILRRQIKAGGAVVDRHLDRPLAALREILRPLLDKDARLHEFVRRVDVRWGEMFVERPHFQQPGEAPHPDDDYTHESVRRRLSGLMARVEAEIKG